MAQTQRLSARAVHHKMPDAVAIDELSDRVRSLARAARKQTSAPPNPRDYQLIRSIECGKNQALPSVVKYVFTNLRNGESLDDVLQPLWAIIHAATEYCSADADVAFEAYIRLENEYRAEEARLELEYVLGDHSTPTLQLLDTTLRKHETLIADERSAIHRKLYLGDRIAVA